MSQDFSSTGRRVPVSVVRSGPNIIAQIKTQDKDGYRAIQIGFGSKKTKHTSKPLQGHLQKTSQPSTINHQQSTFPKYLREVKIPESEEYKVGDTISPQDVLAPGDLVQVTGISRGKGFAGVVKRWGFAGGPRTHGQSDRERAPGSIGQTTTPGRVFKGKKMAGRMGGERQTVKNLTVVSVAEDGTIKLSGPIPGPRGSLLLIKKVGENKKWEK